MKDIIVFIKRKIYEVWNFHRLATYVVLGIILILFVLSFFIDVGYILTIAAVFGIYKFADKTSKEDPDILKIEENNKRKQMEKEVLEYQDKMNELIIELQNLEKYIEENPTDFVAWKRKNEIEEILKDF